MWNAYLSTLSHSPEIDPAQVINQVSSLSDAAANIPSNLGLTSGPVQLPPFERLLPEGSAVPNWFHSQNFGPIKLAPLERLLPSGTSFDDFRLALPRKIMLAPTRLYPMWLQPLLGDGGSP